MTKLIAILAFVSVFSVSSGYAGNVGSEVNVTTLVPFVSLEGSGTWHKSGNFEFNRLHINNDLHPWGGRLAGGLAYLFTDKVNFTLETGWNYFGSASDVGDLGTENVSIDGADLLIGASYLYKKFEFFGKAGTLFQRALYHMNIQNFALRLGNPIFSGHVSSRGLQTAVLPEIKVGGFYNINNVLGVSLAYMHAFGYDPSMKGSAVTSTSGSNVQVNMTANLRNPSLNSVLLGIRYNFVRV